MNSFLLYLKLAWRNVWRHKRRTVIVLLAIGLGMMMMMFYDGLIAGFDQAIYGNAVRVLGGNITVHAAGYGAAVGQKPLIPLANDTAIAQAIQKQPNVVAASRRIETGGLASNRKGAFAISIVGIEPEAEAPASLIAKNVKEGRNLTAADQDAVLIGRGLADGMEVKVGDRVTLVGRALHDQMRQRTMTVIGIYDVGLRDIEKRTAYISLAEAQDLYDLTGQSTAVTVAMQKLGQEPPVIAAMRQNFPSAEFQTWKDAFPEMEQAITTKGGVMDIFSVILMVIAAIGILNLLLMAVYERTREIGLLGAIGLKPRQISWLFILEGALIGLLGVVFGIALGLACNFLLGQVGLDFSKFGSVTDYMALLSGKVYPTLGMDHIAQRSLVILVICTLAAFYPAREAARAEPAQALHFV
ncbi:MAG TPA: FtsX-like permease family protein [Thermoflexales bacterium]|nr:FtsX-like permease family protein [Thermoflexales bacterium]